MNAPGWVQDYLYLAVAFDRPPLIHNPASAQFEAMVTNARMAAADAAEAELKRRFRTEPP